MTDTGISSEDWPARATATAVGYVDRVRDLTTGRALSVSRLVVYGLAMLLAGSLLVMLLLIALIRLVVWLTDFVPGVESGETWLAYYILGTVFFVAGLLLWRKASK